MRFFNFLKENDPLSILMSLGDEESTSEKEVKKKIKEFEKILKDLDNHMSSVIKSIIFRFIF